MKNVADYQAFEAGLTVLLDSATGLDIGDDRLCELLVNYLDEQMQRWRAGIDRDYASRAFHEHLQNKGRGSIAECVLEWAEGCANDIRWPLAFVYFATGKLPGEYRENTTVVVVVEDRKGKIVGHQVIHWCDYAAHRGQRGALRRFQQGDRQVRDRPRSPIYFRLPLRREAP